MRHTSLTSNIKRIILSMMALFAFTAIAYSQTNQTPDRLFLVGNVNGNTEPPMKVSEAIEFEKDGDIFSLKNVEICKSATSLGVIRVSDTEAYNEGTFYGPKSGPWPNGVETQDITVRGPSQVYQITLNPGTYDFTVDFKNMTMTVKESEDLSTAIADILTGSTETAVYYNLQGVPVSNPGRGLYIKRIGNRSYKVFID